MEFRAEAAKLVLEQGLSQREAASRLGISKCTRVGKEKPAPEIGSVAELEAESARLRKELAEDCLERDILKEAAYFARESQPVTRG